MQFATPDDAAVFKKLKELASDGPYAKFFTTIEDFADNVEKRIANGEDVRDVINLSSVKKLLRKHKLDYIDSLFFIRHFDGWIYKDYFYLSFYAIKCHECKKIYNKWQKKGIIQKPFAFCPHK